MQMIPMALCPGFLGGDGDAFLNARWIMRADFGADAILQGSNDFAARRVILRIRAEDKRDIKRQPERVSLNLNIAFLHDVEKAYLNFPCEVRQFINGKNAAI